MGDKTANPQENATPRQYLDIVGVILVAINAKQEITLLNRKGCAVLGCQEQEAVGKNWFDTFVPARDRAREKAAFEVLMAGESKPAEYSESPVLTQTGGERIVAWHNALVRDSEGKIVGMLSSGDDVTERKRIEQVLQERTHALGERVKELNCLYGISELVAGAGTLETILQGTVRLIPPAWQYPEITCARLIVQGQELRTENWEESDWKQTADILVNGRPDGSLQVYYLEKKPERDEGPFLKEERSLLNAIAEQLGRIIERKRADLSVERERDNLTNILDSMVDGIYIVNQDYAIQYVNPALRREFGDPGTRKCYEYFDGSKDVCPWCKNAEVFAGKTVRWEWFSRKTQRIFDKIETPIRNADGSVSKLVIFRDITERKQTEEQLREARERLEVRVQERTAQLTRANEELAAEVAERKRAEESAKTERQRLYDVLEMLPAYVVLLTPDYHVPFANRFFRERFGESDGKRCFEYLFGRTEPCEVCETYGVLKTNAPHRWEWTGPDGRTYDIFDFPFTEADGSTLVLEMGIDITDRKRAEAEVAKHRERLEELVQERTGQLEAANAQLLVEIAERKRAEEKLIWLASFPERNPNPVLEVESAGGAVVYLNPAAKRLFPDLEARAAAHPFLAGLGVAVETLQSDPSVAVRREVVVDDACYAQVISGVPDGERVRVYGIDITERKRVEREVRENREDLNRAQAVAHTGSWRLDVRRNELLWSDETYRIFGIPMGTPLTYETFLATVHPDDREYVDRMWTAALRGEPYDIEHRIVVGDTVRWVRERAELEFDEEGALCGGFGTAQDITERKRADEALRDSEDLIRRVLETTPDCIFVKDKEGRYILANRQTAELYGTQPEEVIGKTDQEFSTRDAVTTEEAEGFREADRKVIETKQPIFIPEETVTMPDGRVRYFQTTKIPLAIRGNPDCVLGVAADITERRQMETALRKSERELAIKNRISEIFLAVPDQEVYGEVLKVVLRELQSEYGFFGYIAEDGAMVSPSLTADIWERCQISDKSIRFPRESWGGLWGRSLLEKRTLVSNTALCAPEGHVPLTRAIAAPLLLAGEVIGQITIANKATDYDEADRELLETLAAHIAPILNLRLQRDRQSQARQQAEEALRALQLRLRAEQGFAGIVGRHPKMIEMFEAIREVAEVDAPVLIQGESGTGKELVANAIHSEGHRRDKPFIPVNCSALPETLLASELFGHVRGAFTGAIRDKKGRFELADKGTIFLDEVGDLSPAIQVALLRVLQERTIERVGGEKPIKVDVRVISATNKDLSRMVAAGKFREDLFYRLCVIPMSLPPLRDRRGDIPLLANHILRQVLNEMGREALTLSPEIVAAMMDYDWPGNVRELQNAIHYATLKCKGNVLELHHLPAVVSAAPDRLKRRAKRGRKQKLTAEAVRRALEEAQGNRTEAARKLGVTRTTLYQYIGRAAK